jgi:hypothetical protein
VDPLVHLADDGQQVAPGGLEVLELSGEEAVPLLQCRELLQGERVDLAESGQVALRLRRPPLRSYGTGAGCGSPAASAAATCCGVGGTGAAGPYSASRVGRSTPYSSAARASSASIR